MGNEIIAGSPAWEVPLHGSQVPEAGMHRPGGRTLSDLGCRRLGRRGERNTGPTPMGLGLLLVLVLVSTMF